MADSKLVRGTLILTASIFISKILGLIYIFPFQAIVGLEGLALYSFGYIPYTVLLSVATLGIPLAVSKFVSKYNALGDYETGRRLFKSGLIVMSITGLISFFILFLLAEPIANQVVDGKDLKGNTIDDVILTIRMVSVALLVVPIMSLIRGYFQGHQSMGPTAVSQVIEQIVRIIFILCLTFVIVHVMNGSIALAVAFATFGAFVGALGGLTVLLYYWFRRRVHLNNQLLESKVNHHLPLTSIYKELITYALPLSFVGLAIPLYQMIDLMTFNKALYGIGYDQVAVDKAFGAFSQAAHKLILIPVSIATAMSLTILPTITKSYINNDQTLLQRQVTQTYQIILYLTLPAAIGLSLLANPAYGALFGLEDIEIGAWILRYYAPVAVLFSIFAVTSAILQGINQQRFAVIGLLAGLIVKLSFNTFFLTQLGAVGAIYATGLGYLTSLGVNIWAIGKYGNYNYTFVLKRFLLISIFSLIMAVIVVVTKEAVSIVLPLENRLNAFIVLLVSVAVGGLVYLYLGIRSNLAGQILGSRFKFLNKKQRSQESGS
ncbi:polysaccharide biosynthesis protein [Anaerobacillus alkaliphilus]|uniref:Polysaccharide biosynthesis protein n=1 Tax=Anaerobacillus alkaliphilus TaxID=1548597 RepID=A0A4Q0VQ75_9BACI|nr:polysaccharide biosynthesis protein [Anaerobacillus alkaliphilus]RXI98646.1 polysaccharide biosynthesis protein [Anaerobacillus alkaliphilus]